MSRQLRKKLCHSENLYKLYKEERDREKYITVIEI